MHVSEMKSCNFSFDLCLQILETQVSNLKDILLSIPKEDIRKKQEMLKVSLRVHETN